MSYDEKNGEYRVKIKKERKRESPNHGYKKAPFYDRFVIIDKGEFKPDKGNDDNPKKPGTK